MSMNQGLRLLDHCVNVNFQSLSKPVSQSINPKTGRCEQVFVDLEAVYTNYGEPDAEEYCFEELRARDRGWLAHDWNEVVSPPTNPAAVTQLREKNINTVIVDLEVLPVQNKAALHLTDTELYHDENVAPSQEDLERVTLAKKLRKEERANRTKKIGVMEVRGETQTGKSHHSLKHKP